MASQEAQWTIGRRPIMGADEPHLWPPAAGSDHLVREVRSRPDFKRCDRVLLSPVHAAPAKREKAFARTWQTLSRWFDRLTGKMQLDDVVWHHGMGEPVEDPPSIFLDARTVRAMMTKAR